MNVANALELLRAKAIDASETFYGSAEGLALGTGLFVDEVEFTVFDPEKDRFTAKRGLVYVLSHECDLDPANDRLLNQSALVCPAVRMDAFVEQMPKAGLRDDEIGAFLGNLARRNVSRAVYLPPMHGVLETGGLLYLNEMASTPVRRLQSGAIKGAVTAVGLQTIDYAIENHLRRPKASPLALAHAGIRRSTTLRG